MPPHSLYDLAKQQLIRNISMLDDIGDIPYSFLAPVLRHIQHPQQLIELEARCPQLPGETGEIWLRFIKRDIPNWESRSYQPKDPKNWSRAYRKLLKDAEREKLEQEEALKESMRALQKSREGNKTLIVEGKTGYDPANRRWGFGSSRGTGGSVWKGGGSWGEPGAPRKTGKIVLDKLKRGVFDHKMARPKATMMPAHILAERRGVVRSVPERLVRMTQNEGSKSEAPKPTAVPVVDRSGFPNPTLRKPITSRAVPQQSGSTANKSLSDKPVQRPSLPAGQHFTAPKLQAPSVDAPRPVKRRREAAPSIFHPSKKRRS